MLREKYEVELIGTLPSDRYSFMWEDRKGKPVINTLNLAVHRNRDLLPGGELPDFVVMGHHGRKGPKEISTTLGSNSDRALRFFFHSLSLNSIDPFLYHPLSLKK